MESLNSFGLLILRLGMGGYMLTHGWGKVLKVVNGDFQFADPIGLGAQASLVLAAGAEFGCALLVIAGLLTRLAAIPLVFTMAVAAFRVHIADPWTAGEAARLFQEGQTKFPASKEMALLYLIGFLTLVFTGPGRLSLDGALWRRKNRSGTVETGG
jgi:putative oxidoreductase